MASVSTGSPVRLDPGHLTGGSRHQITHGRRTPKWGGGEKGQGMGCGGITDGAGQVGRTEERLRLKAEPTSDRGKNWKSPATPPSPGKSRLKPPFPLALNYGLRVF